MLGTSTFAYRQSDADASSAYSYLSSPDVTDFDVQVNLRVETDPATGTRSGSFLWRYTDSNNYYELRLGSSASETGLGKMVNGSWTWLDQTNSFTYTASSWYTASVKMVGSSISAYFWGSYPTWVATDSSLSGTTVAFKTSLADARFDNLQVRKIVGSDLLPSLGTEKTRPTSTTKYYFASAKRIALRVGGSLSYIFSDHLGSTSVISSTVSGPTSTVVYYAFGQTRASSCTVQTDRLYTGQALDSYIKLYGMGSGGMMFWH